MKMITSFANPRVAQAFVDYMATQGVVLTLQRHEQSDVWLVDDGKEDYVRAELAAFLAQPDNPRYLAASWQAGDTGSGLRYQGYPFFKALRERAGALTIAIAIACIFVFIAMQLVGDRAVMIWLAWPSDDSQSFEIWRYFTHALLHFSLLHILFNLIWWWYLGGAMEKTLGSGKLLVLTLVSALFSGFVQHAFSGAWFGGLSGVVYALMGYVWLYGERQPEGGLYLERGIMVFAVLWLIVGWFDWFGMSIANGAHAAGLVIGLAMALVDTRHARKRT
ncbi:rhomboid family intramembrane serine protease GlpG [Erwinia sp. HR93]|uniref:rhomboid family intramembrane serine protease GlpG n=1 Tax=Erwinia sp. HR93 TaxID=3094840 RepID=UPI002ADED14D|nr:rhomboid family intramembrane serine protease GlpG [Erwinia sp. HR93]MEA1063074.1 rhomboid family intramembrane serine protease GlpG [Erwinia sp. HR93]